MLYHPAVIQGIGKNMSVSSYPTVPRFPLRPYKILKFLRNLHQKFNKVWPIRRHLSPLMPSGSIRKQDAYWHGRVVKMDICKYCAEFQDKVLKEILTNRPYLFLPCNRKHTIIFFCVWPKHSNITQIEWNVANSGWSNQHKLCLRLRWLTLEAWNKKKFKAIDWTIHLNGSLPLCISTLII